MKKLLALLVAFCAVPASAVVGVVASPSVTAGLVVKSIGAQLSAVNVVSGASAGYVMVLDAVAIPADGAVAPVVCMPLAANTGLDLNFRANPMRFVNGITIVFSTTGCYSKTASATAFIAGSAQ